MGRDKSLRFFNQFVSRFITSVLLVIVLCPLISTAAESPSSDAPILGNTLRETIQRSNRFYGEGDFKSALSGYDSALKQGVDNGYIYYNLANTYFRLGSYGKAIVNYHRARQLLPRNAEVAANLELARKKAPGSSSEIKSAQSTQSELPAKLLAGLLSYQELKLGAVISAALFWLLFVVWRLKPGARSVVPLILSFALTILLICSFMFTRYSPLNGFQLAFSSQSRAIGGAVVMERELKVYAGNSQTFQVIYILKEGAEIETGEEREGWIQVGLPGGRVGWVQKDGLETI